jgi:hypothetical protein
MLVIWPLAIVIWALATVHDENTYVEQGSALRFYPMRPRAVGSWDQSSLRTKRSGNRR